MKVMGIVVAAAMAAGCASSQKLDGWALAEAKTPLLCKNKEECDLYWRRAQVWLAANSTYRIQSATDTVISTHGPQQHDPNRAYQVVRVPLENGRERIVLSSGCANLFGCSTDEGERTLSFKRFVSGQQ